MAPGPERPDAAKGDQRSPDAMDYGFGGIRVVRFRANNAGIMKVLGGDRYIMAVDVADSLEIAEFEGGQLGEPICGKIAALIAALNPPMAKQF